MQQFLTRAILFTALLIGVTAAVELTLAHLNRATYGKYRIGQDVYQALEDANAPHPEVITLYLGDSVARQLFRPHDEPSPKLLYLASNQAIGVAGQYCVLQRVIDHAPRLRRVYLFYTPLSWQNDLDQIFTHDYFCGYFHSPALVWEIWNLKHDRQLTEAHLGRMFLPNLMAENSYINRSQANYGVPIAPSAPPSGKPFSAASQHFLEKMKELCRRQRISLTILPCPCVGTPERFAALTPVYDAPITFYDADLFLPGLIHLKKPNIEPIRRRMIQQYGLDNLD